MGEFFIVLGVAAGVILLLGLWLRHVNNDIEDYG